VLPASGHPAGGGLGDRLSLPANPRTTAARHPDCSGPATGLVRGATIFPAPGGGAGHGPSRAPAAAPPGLLASSEQGPVASAPLPDTTLEDVQPREIVRRLASIVRRLASIVLRNRPAGARGVGMTVAALAGLQVLLGALVATSVTAGLDAAVSSWFIRFDEPGLAHALIRSVYPFGQFWLVWLTVLAASALTSSKVGSLRPFLVGGTTMIVLDGLILPYKYLLGRSFPHSGLNEVFVGAEAYPSGHAAHGTFAMLMLAALISRVRPPAPGRGWWGLQPWAVVPAAVLAFGAGIANTMLGYHWPTDVVGGWTIGLMAFVIAYWLQKGDVTPAAVPADSSLPVS
jgi:membrane-associated phospholipid phosphatase